VPVRVEGYVALLREIVTVDAIEGVSAEAKNLFQTEGEPEATYPFVILFQTEGEPEATYMLVTFFQVFELATNISISATPLAQGLLRRCNSQ